LSHQIQTVDGKAVDAKTYAQQTATAINTRLESLETYKNEEGTRAEQYLSASRTETAKQLSAERTVISANYVAKSTFEENARGVTEKFENLRVGGTNLLSLSKAVKGFYKFTKGENVPSAHYAYGIPIAVDNKARYVLQAWSRTINDFSWIGAIQLNNEGRMIDNSYLSIYPSKTSLYFKRDISILPNAKYIQFSFSNDVLGDDPNLKIQFEKGSLPTDYKMAEEDQQSYADTKIAEYRNTVEETSAELSRQIQLADGKAVEAKTYAQQTTDAIKTRLESLETYKNEEGTRAEQYLSASRTETAKQLSAERTVISANYVAKSTFEENARGVTEKFENLRVGGTNLLSLSKAVKGFYKFTKGENVPSAHYAYGIPIAVDNKARYVLQAWSRTINDFSWIGAIQLNNEGRMIDNSYLSIHPSKTSLYFKRDISILPNAKYIQFSFSNDVLGDDPNLKIQFEKGSLPTDYKMAEEDQQSYADTKIAEYRNTVDGRFATLQSQKANQVDLQTVRETANLYERIIGSTETGIK
ncbi:hypothetical protein, partial [Streptococcus suis]|uniref:hypothetical protein n=1 Tax=Streptococcus suis TaxID=1307 RepID=UPI002FCA682C